MKFTIRSIVGGMALTTVAFVFSGCSGADPSEIESVEQETSALWGKPDWTLSGAGQRLNFSFGGRLWVYGSVAGGEFAIMAHPQAPAGPTLNVACRYYTFFDVSVVTDPLANSITFDALGRCSTLATSGELSGFDAHNRIQIVDNPGGDAIGMSFVGPTGIAIAGGPLSFGDFTLAQ